MKKLWRVMSIMALALATFIVVFNVLYLRPANPMTVEEVERKLDNAMGIGIQRSDVESFLRNEQISFRYIDGDEEDLSLYSEVEQLGLPKSQLDSAIQAVISDTHRSLSGTRDIRLTFAFGRDDRLVKWRVRAIYSGI